MENVLRPKMEILPDSARVPAGNLIEPPPNRFTHAVESAQPYYYSTPRKGAAPDGEFAAGAEVVLISHDGPTCRVADARGLLVTTAFAGLRPLK